jgi:hypothetical protein
LKNNVKEIPMLENLYFFAQIIASVAMVGSLVFVGVQIRGNTRDQELTRANDGADNYSRFQILLIENPEFRDVWVKGGNNMDVLNPAELIAFGAFLALWVDSANRMMFQIRAGYSADTWERAKARYKPITRRKGTHQWWQKARLGYEENVRIVIDDILSDVQIPAG